VTKLRRVSAHRQAGAAAAPANLTRQTAGWEVGRVGFDWKVRSGGATSYNPEALTHERGGTYTTIASRPGPNTTRATRNTGGGVTKKRYDVYYYVVSACGEHGGGGQEGRGGGGGGERSVCFAKTSSPGVSATIRRLAGGLRRFW